jgi:hypothetical protein
MDQNYIDKGCKSLPLDLQRKILVEFLRTHSMRKGKLIAKLILDKKFQLVKDLVRVRKCCSWLYNKYDNEDLFIYGLEDKHVHFREDPNTHETIFLYRTTIYGGHTVWKVNFMQDRMDDSVVLPPFKKNTYESYPFTNKKRSRNISLN